MRSLVMLSGFFDALALPRASRASRSRLAASIVRSWRFTTDVDNPPVAFYLCASVEDSYSAGKPANSSRPDLDKFIDGLDVSPELKT